MEKVVTTGGGGILLTNSNHLAKRAKHITTTAKLPHNFEYIFNETGYNYRLPNINAALGVAQSKVERNNKNKRKIYQNMKNISKMAGIQLFKEPKNCKSNYWLQTLVLDKKFEKFKNIIIKKGNENNIGMRPCWKPLHTLKHLRKYPKMNLKIQRIFTIEL